MHFYVVNFWHIFFLLITLQPEMINLLLREMKDMKKVVLAGMLFLLSTMTLNATEDVTGKDAVDTTYIKLDDNREPINHVNLTKEELEAKVGELETILETENFQLYAAGDYTYKIVDGVVTSMAIQIPDDNNDKVVYNQILNALAKSNSIEDTHNTGGNHYLYANFQIQFDDFEGYEKLTFLALEK